MNCPAGKELMWWKEGQWMETLCISPSCTCNDPMKLGPPRHKADGTVCGPWCKKKIATLVNVNGSTASGNCTTDRKNDQCMFYNGPLFWVDGHWRCPDYCRKAGYEL